jgi:hypothetical protein
VANLNRSSYELTVISLRVNFTCAAREKFIAILFLLFKDRRYFQQLFRNEQVLSVIE